MEQESKKELSPYRLGVAAGHRLPPYGKEKMPECPFEKGTPECEQWWEGFDNGTEDYIKYYQYLNL